MNDVIVEPVRKIREELINRYGGIDGYFRHCQAQERQRATHSKAPRRKQPAHEARKGTRAR